jgi:membrane protein required for colicin V production
VNSLDALFIIICLGFLGLGLSHGFIRSVSSLIAIIVGLFFAKKLEPFISKVLAIVHIGNPKGVLGYFFVFFCIFITVKIILFLFQKLTRATGLGPIDRALGGILGLTKGVIIVAIISALLQVALPGDSAVLTNSRILPFTNKVVSAGRAVLPNAIYEHVFKGKPINIEGKIKEHVQEKIKDQFREKTRKQGSDTGKGTAKGKQ